MPLCSQDELEKYNAEKLKNLQSEVERLKLQLDKLESENSELPSKIIFNGYQVYPHELL